MELNMMSELFGKWVGYEIAATCVLVIPLETMLHTGTMSRCCNEGIY